MAPFRKERAIISKSKLTAAVGSGCTENWRPGTGSCTACGREGKRHARAAGRKIRPSLVATDEPKIMGDYAELHVTSNFSFLRGGATRRIGGPRRNRWAAGRKAAITDINTLAGIVHWAYRRQRNRDALYRRLPPSSEGRNRHFGCGRLPDIPPLLSILVYPTSRESYGRLCRLLTMGKRRAIKGECDLTLQDVLDHSAGLLAIAVPPPLPAEGFEKALRQLKEAFYGDRLSLAATRLYSPQDKERLTEAFKG